MKNCTKWLGIIALVAVIGLLAACGGSEPEKTIVITGIPAEYQTASWNFIHVCPAGSKPVAEGDGQVSGSTVTYDLFILQWPSENSPQKTNERWTGKGTCDVLLYIEGRWVAYLNNISITGALKTIPFSQFTLL